MDIAPNGFLEEMNEHIARDRGEDFSNVTPDEWVQVCTKKSPELLGVKKNAGYFGFSLGPPKEYQKKPVFSPNLIWAPEKKTYYFHPRILNCNFF
jgi:hypothetical protein